MATLEFTLDPADLPRLRRWPGIRASRAAPVRIVWHDTAAGDLATDGLSLASVAGRWQLARRRAATPGGTVLVEADVRQPGQLERTLPADLQPQAWLDGTRQSMRWVDADHSATLRLVEGRLGSRRAPPLCRLWLDGVPSELPPLATALAAELDLRVPRAALAEQALAAARAEAPTPRALGAPLVTDGQTVSDSLATIAGHLLDVMLHWGSQVPKARSPEPVHQMRVATRRLRSALSVYRAVAACPDLAALTVPMKTCAERLGTARDWDVFIGGLGARLAEAFPDDRRCAALLRTAERRRRQAYAVLDGFLAGPEFRTLAVSLACAATLRPWDGAAPPEGLAQDAAGFAAEVLARRLKRVRQAGRRIETLEIPALHELRKKCKRLRYAAEFFSPLFPARKTKRFIKRLADLQEQLGLLNDGAAVSGLMAQLGRLERSYAAGLVEGFSAAAAAPARERVEAAWTRFRAAEPFWTA